MPKANYLLMSLLLSAFLLASPLWAQKQRIRVEIDLGVELINALEVQNAAEFLKDSLSDPYLYRTTRLMRISYEFFAPFRQHPAVTRTHWMTEKIGTGIYLLPLFYEGFPRPRRHTPVSPDILQAIHPQADSAAQLVDEYMQLASAFYRDAGFASFQRKYQYVYTQALAQVKRNLPPAGFIPTMEAYYGARKIAYRLIINPFFKANWGMAWEVTTSNGRVANQIAAPLGEQTVTANRVTDAGFDNPEQIRNLSVHEFGHTFVNPLTALPGIAPSLAAHKNLFRSIPGQGQYSDWETSFNEHLVRAGEVRIALALGLPKVAQQLRTDNANWMYLPFFEKQLARFEANRKRYPTLASFLPDLIAELQTIPH